MTDQEYQKTAADLNKLVAEIPLHWGKVQNNYTDDKINMFKLSSYNELIAAIKDLPEDEQIYQKRRWFLWMCSKCDEHIFCQGNKGKLNPVTRDKSYDIEFLGDANLRFDIKGTVVPLIFRKNDDTTEPLFKDPQPLVKHYYEKQSKERRFGIQNRLFIVHHSFKDDPREELKLRCNFQFKEDMFKKYIQRLEKGNKRFFHYMDAMADVIFIIDRKETGLECIYFE